jgi:hypothetical protein
MPQGVAMKYFLIAFVLAVVYKFGLPYLGQYSDVQLGVAGYALAFVYTVFHGMGSHRRIVVFRDYDDLGLSFLVPISFVGVLIFLRFLGMEASSSLWVALAVAFLLMGKILKDSFEDNEHSIPNSLLAVLIKIPLSVFWIFNILSLVSPGGNTAAQRKKNRKNALIFLAIVSPVIALLVVEKRGSLFNPKEWLKGRHVGTLRKYL